MKKLIMFTQLFSLIIIAKDLINLQTQVDSEIGVRFNIPCKTTLCAKFLKKLNPSNDWVSDKSD